MTLKERLIELLHRRDYVPQGYKELASTLELNYSDKLKLKKVCKELLDEGTIARIKKDRFCVPKDADLASGPVKFRASGSATVEVVPEDGGPSDIFHIRAEDTHTAFHGDQALVRIKANSRSQRRQDGTNEAFRYARIIRILKRRRETFVGTLRRKRNFFYVIPDDPRFGQDFLVSPPEPLKCGKTPEEGDKVVVRLLDWEQRHLNPVAEIESLLGETHTPMAEYLGILHKYGLDPEFPDAVMREAEKIAPTVKKRDLKGRQDCRKTLTLTIDPVDAKDFDDALSLETTPEGDLIIGVHVADVSAYVKHNSKLDREAQKRCNSTYLVGSVIPMLPHKLSSGICSLVEGEDRLTKTVFFTFSKNGILKDHSFANTVICSDKRFTYEEAYALLKEDDLSAARNVPHPKKHQTGHPGRALTDMLDKELKKYQKAIRSLWDIAGRMRAVRMREGSLDFDMPEVKILLDEEGYADSILNCAYDESHQLIEEFMLAANEAVAKTLNGFSLPYISRVHDKPDAGRLNELRETLMDYGIKTGDLSNKKEVTKLLKMLKTHPQGYTLKIEFLRGLKQACYRAEADGHYGLHKAFYAHFTSPIRRYSDLIVHRILDHYLVKSGHETAQASHPHVYSKADLVSMSEQISLSERNSTEAERDSTKIKLLEFFDRELLKEKKTSFPAVITDIRNHGMFIELTDSMAFGMVHLSTLTDDLYFVREGGACLVGRRSGRKFCSGQTVHVMIERVDRFKRQMDFRLTEFSGQTKKRGKGKPGNRLRNAPKNGSKRPVKSAQKGSTKSTPKGAPGVVSKSVSKDAPKNVPKKRPKKRNR